MRDDAKVKNARERRQEFEKKALEANFDVNILELNDVSMNELSNMENVAIITSTTGEGDLPTNGDDFWVDLEKSTIDLSRVKYSVCALGDRSHETFCGAGKKVDEKLLQLGAKKILERQDCDGSDEGSEEWGNTLLSKF